MPKVSTYAVTPETQTKPCKRGHIAGRTASGSCLACLQLLSATHYAKSKALGFKKHKTRKPKAEPPRITGANPHEILRQLLDHLGGLPQNAIRTNLIHDLRRISSNLGRHQIDFTNEHPQSFSSGFEWAKG